MIIYISSVINISVDCKSCFIYFFEFGRECLDPAATMCDSDLRVQAYVTPALARHGR